MTDFAQAFLTITTFQMLWNEIGPLVSQVLPSHRAKSHDFFDALGGIYSQNAFPSPIIRINSFLHVSKTTSYKHKNLFCELRDFYLKFGVSNTRFSCDTSK